MSASLSYSVIQKIDVSSWIDRPLEVSIVSEMEQDKQYGEPLERLAEDQDRLRTHGTLSGVLPTADVAHRVSEAASDLLASAAQAVGVVEGTVEEAGREVLHSATARLQLAKTQLKRD